MPKMLDLECRNCGAEVDDLFFLKVPNHIIHLECGGEMDLVYRLRSRSAQWSDRDAVVVFQDKEGHYRFPGRNDVETPKGYQRVELKSLREVEKFEKSANVRSEIAWYDRGSGNSFDKDAPQPKKMTESERYDRFRKITQGIF